MAKNKNFCKKPLLILSLCLVAVFAAALIIMAVVPYAATPYTYKTQIGSSEVVTKYYVSKDEVKIVSIVDGEKKDPDTYDTYVKDGKLYISYTGLAYTIYGEIDGNKLVVSDDVVAVNNFTKVLKIVSIVGVSLGGVGLVLYLVLNSKGGKSKAKRNKK